LYVPDVPGSGEVRAWRPAVAGVTEVLHARFTDHVYPAHTHDAWTLLLVDEGAVRYDLHRHGHGASRSLVTLLPPGVPHDGRAQTPGGFRKRVVYLEPGTLGAARIGPAVDRPAVDDPVLRARISTLHAVLGRPGDELEARSRLALVVERLGRHLDRAVRVGPPVRDDALADRLRDLIDSRVREGVDLDDAAAALGVHPTHAVRAFTRRHGLPPHRYLTGRRVDLARRLLLDGLPAAHVAAAAGFYDQAHLTRHFRRMLATPPAAYARSSRNAGR
jgi:AraC-like DNA-binding protein